MRLQHAVHGAHAHLLSCCVGFECKMDEWHTILDQLEIPDGAVAGLSASDKPVLRGKLLQLPAADRPFFFVGQPLDVLKTLRTLLPDAPSGQPQRFFNMILTRGLLQRPCASWCIMRASLVSTPGSQQQMSILQQFLLSFWVLCAALTRVLAFQPVRQPINDFFPCVSC